VKICYNICYNKGKVLPTEIIALILAKQQFSKFLFNLLIMN